MPWTIVTLSDVTEANRKPSKRFAYSRFYLNLSGRGRKMEREEERENVSENPFCDVICAIALCAAATLVGAIEVESIEKFLVGKL